MRLMILQNIVKTYFTLLYIPLIIWEFLITKKIIENIQR